MLIVLIGHIGTVIVNIQCFKDLQKYVCFKDEYDSFVAIAKPSAYIQDIPRICNLAALRKIDPHVFEIFFCGRKMCYDGSSNIVSLCEQDEHHTKWELLRMEAKGNVYMIRFEDMCLTLIAADRIEMRVCREGVDISQLFHLVMHVAHPRFFVDDDISISHRREHFFSLLKKNENDVRFESLCAINGS